MGLFHGTVCAGGWICVDVTDCWVWVYFMARCVRFQRFLWTALLLVSTNTEINIRYNIASNTKSSGDNCSYR